MEISDISGDIRTTNISRAYGVGVNAQVCPNKLLPVEKERNYKSGDKNIADNTIYIINRGESIKSGLVNNENKNASKSSNDSDESYSDPNVNCIAKKEIELIEVKEESCDLFKTTEQLYSDPLDAAAARVPEISTKGTIPPGTREGKHQSSMMVFGQQSGQQHTIQHSILGSMPPRLSSSPVTQSPESPLSFWQSPQNSPGGTPVRSGDDIVSETQSSRKVPLLSPTQEVVAIAWFSCHPQFYDQGNPGFMQRNERDRLLRTQAEIMGVSGPDLWTWFNNQRTQYCKDKKQQKSHPSVRAAWRLKNFTFLDEHIKARATSKQLGRQVLHTQYPEGEDLSVDDPLSQDEDDFSQDETEALDRRRHFESQDNYAWPHIGKASLLSSAQEVVALDWFSRHPQFYDQGNPDFMNRNVRDRLLRTQAEIMKVSGPDLWTWFKNQRTQYSRDKKQQKMPKSSGSSRRASQPSVRAAWRLKNFTFLDDHIRFRAPRKQLGHQGLHTQLPEGEDLSLDDPLSHDEDDFSQDEIEATSRCRRGDSLDNYAEPHRGRASLLSPAQEVVALDWFSCHPQFYDQGNPDFMNRNVRDRLLRTQSEIMRVSGPDLWTWFKNQRTQYNKDKKQQKMPKLALSRRGSRPSARAAWRLKNFTFLDEHIRFRATSKQLGRQDFHTQLPEGEDLSLDDPLSQDEDDFSQDETKDSSRRRRGDFQDDYAEPQPGRQQQAQKRLKIDDSISKLGDQLSDNLKTHNEFMSLHNNERYRHHQWLGDRSQQLSPEHWTEYVQRSSRMMLDYLARQERPPQ